MKLTPLDPADLFVMVGLLVLAGGLMEIGGPWWVVAEGGAALIVLGVLMALRIGPSGRRRP